MFQWLENLIAPSGYRRREEARAAETEMLKAKIVQADIAHVEAVDELLKSAAEAKKSGSRENRETMRKLFEDTLSAMQERHK